MERIEDCISFLVGKAAQQVTRRARDLLAPFNVTPVQYAVLKILADGGSYSGAEIGKRLQLDSASVTGVLDRMERIRLVVRGHDPRDRRAQRIVASREARAMMPQLDGAMDRLNAESDVALGRDKAAFLRAVRDLASDAKWSRDV